LIYFFSFFFKKKNESEGKSEGGHVHVREGGGPAEEGKRATVMVKESRIEGWRQPSGRS
jgi:hypothetical protein